MKKGLMAMVAMGLMVAVPGTWAVAAEGEGWFEAVQRLEVEAEERHQEAEALRGEWQAIDTELARSLTDTETAERATRGLRKEVAQSIAQWDRGQRGAARQAVVEGPLEARMVERAVEASGWPVSEEWRRQVRLLAEVDEGVDYGQALIRERAQVTRQAAGKRALVAAADKEREEVAEEAQRHAGAEELAQEVEETAQGLSAYIEGLEARERDGDFHRLKGTLRRPIAGEEVTHGYGPRQREGSFTKNRHTGLTYVVEEGTPVRAVADGEVVARERMPGFGKLVIVDHGDEYHSIYAHLSEIEVEEGQAVERRSVLGASGETGSLEGPKFYFEFRRRGQPIDPEAWFIQH